MKRTIFISFLFALLFFSSNVFAADVFTKDLKYGNNNSAVSQLQDFLKDEKIYTGPVTGRFLALTKDAVERFQIREKINPTSGYFGPLTRRRANEILKNKDAQTISHNKIIFQTSTLSILPQSNVFITPTVATSDIKIIDAQTVVGLHCYFRIGSSGEIVSASRGSGVIVSSDGFILTARHLVDPQFSESVDPTSFSSNNTNNLKLDYCDVGQVPVGSVLATPDLIRSVNPSIEVPVLAYRSELIYEPSSTPVISREERRRLDFAVLKINSISRDGFAHGIASLPQIFPYAEMLRTITPNENDEVLTYGFPGDISEAKGRGFDALYLVGSVGRIKNIYGGDNYFYNAPLLVRTTMEIGAGRSGSPLFWHGRVAGIVTAYSSGNITDSFSVSASAILQTLHQSSTTLSTF